MNAIKRQLGLAMSVGLAAASLWACVATHNSDGSIKLEFAPDMTITAWGLEDALGKLVDLLADCRSGNFARPCTQSERDDVSRAIDKVLDRKERMGSPDGPSQGGSCGV